ncbi:MAG: FAD-dependent oxidoreductase [Chloroflexi bacterium]|nr:FAD-dependent oxidoreductase [Chloroflexota bacterium]
MGAKRVIVVGGGVAGCSAAIAVAKAGLESVLVERMDTLSGTGPLTGHLVQYVARMETKLLDGGGKEVIEALEGLSIFPQREFGHQVSCIFDTTKIEKAMLTTVEKAGVEVILRSRVVGVEKEGNKIHRVVLENGARLEGDAFVDATGSTGGIPVCAEWGVGCVGCSQKCTVFGDRVGLSEAAGVPDLPKTASYYVCTYIHPSSIAPWLLRSIQEEESGYFYYQVPEPWQNHDFTSYWPRKDRPVKNNLGRERLIYLMPFVKLFVSTIPMDILHQFPGFEDAYVISPMAQTGNCVKTSPGAPHDETMRVLGLANLFCSGLRSGDFSSLVESIYTGDLAGHNAARTALGITELVTFPKTTMMGFFLWEIKKGYSLSDYPPGSPVDRRYLDVGLDVMEPDRIHERMNRVGLLGLFGQRPI